MHFLRHSLIATRTAATSSFRRRRLLSLAAAGQAPLGVLFYHRVADQHPNGWTISRSQFQRHLDFLQTHFEIIDLAELQRRVDQRCSERPAVAITFDDGYGENSEFALPLLIQRKVPCTYFVTTHHPFHQQAFPHDLAAGQPLRPNSLTEIRAASDGGIEIGCHTQRHVDFSKVTDQETVRSEIVDAKAQLESLINRPVRYFAFPYGMPVQLTRMAIDAVKEAGFNGFCSAYGSYNLPGGDGFHIRRFHGDPSMARLKNWLFFDKRKLHKEPTINYQQPNQPTEWTTISEGSPAVVASAAHTTDSCQTTPMETNS